MDDIRIPAIPAGTPTEHFVLRRHSQKEKIWLVISDVRSFISTTLNGLRASADDFERDYPVASMLIATILVGILLWLMMAGPDTWQVPV